MVWHGARCFRFFTLHHISSGRFGCGYGLGSSLRGVERHRHSEASTCCCTLVLVRSCSARGAPEQPPSSGWAPAEGANVYAPVYMDCGGAGCGAGGCARAERTRTLCRCERLEQCELITRCGVYAHAAQKCRCRVSATDGRVPCVVHGHVACTRRTLLVLLYCRVCVLPFLASCVFTYHCVPCRSAGLVCRFSRQSV